MSRWPEERTMKFVQEYLKHECLWDTTNVHYKNRKIREEAYRSIKLSMNIDGFDEKEVAHKIKNIRSTYSQEKKKVLTSIRLGNIDVYQPTLKWYDLLDMVLSDYYANKIYTTNEETVIQYIPINEEGQIYQDNQLCPVSTELQLVEANTEGNTGTETKFLTLKMTEKTTKKSSAKRKRQKTNFNIKMRDSANEKQEENEFLVFGRNVGLQLMNMPLDLALRAQEHVQAYLTKVRIQNIQSDNDLLHQN